MADFLRRGGITRLSRLDDGRVMCCHCFAYCTHDELEPVANELGRWWDVCRPCWAADQIPPRRNHSPEGDAMSNRIDHADPHGTCATCGHRSGFHRNVVTDGCEHPTSCCHEGCACERFTPDERRNRSPKEGT